VTDNQFSRLELSTRRRLLPLPDHHRWTREVREASGPDAMLSSTVSSPYYTEFITLMPAVRYTEALSSLHATTFVFETLREFHSVRLIASPDDLASVRGVIIAYGRVDWQHIGPLYFQHSRNNQASLRQWEEALQDLFKLSPVREFQIYLYHRNKDSVGTENSVEVAEAA
jgi:hypothetical protein